MGRSILCGCGQRNDLSVFGYGEEKLCLACGSILSDTNTEFVEESFEPEMTQNAFESTGGGEGGSSAIETGFESPSMVEVASAEEKPPPERAWNEGVREAAAEGETGQCARCRNAFRGDWDRTETAEGLLCHVCAVQADSAYVAPSFGERNELLRVKPPQSTELPEVVAHAEWKQKKKGLIYISVVGVAAVLAIVVFPVEFWMAAIFAVDMEEALELPVAWHWVVVGLAFVANAFAQGAGLYVTLGMMDLLYEDDPERNVFLVFYLGFLFALMEALLGWGMSYAGSVAGLLMAIWSFPLFFIKIKMIALKFPLRFEGGCAFLMVWGLCTLLLWPCMRMVESFLGGIVAAIAL